MLKLPCVWVCCGLAPGRRQPGPGQPIILYDKVVNSSKGSNIEKNLSLPRGGFVSLKEQSQVIYAFKIMF